MEIQAVIFDVDGTLLDTEKIYMRAWKKAGETFGYPITDELLRQTRGVCKADSIGIFARQLGADFDYDMVHAERIRLAEELIEASAAEELKKPGVDETLAWLKEQGVALAVASSTGLEKTRSHLAHAGLLDWFAVVVGGDMISRGKPAPDIFLKAAELLGVSPSDCLVVEDTPAGVISASDAGMQVILIPDQVPANETTRTLSRAVLSSMEQLTAAL